MCTDDGGRLHVVEAVRSAAARHLGKGSSSRLRLLEDDLSFLASGVRQCVLWDYWPVTADEDSDEGGFVSGRGSLTGPQVRSFLDELRRSLPSMRSLGLLSVGPSLFVARTAELACRLEEDCAGLLGKVMLVACDASLRAPHLCASAAEREPLVYQLVAIGEQLAAQLRRHGAGCSGGGAGGSGDGGEPAAWAAQLACDGPNLVAMHGWLLHYPSIYCFVGSGAREGGSCLGGQPLCVWRLTARPAGGARAGVGALSEAESERLVCSFSMPAWGGPPPSQQEIEEANACAGARAGGRGAPAEQPAEARAEQAWQRECVRQWWSAVAPRFEAAEARRHWISPRLAASVTVEDAVVL